MYVITGEAYQVQRQLETYKKQFAAEGYEYYSFDITSDEKDEQQLKFFLASQSLFKKNKCVALRIQKADDIKKFIQIYGKQLGDTILIIVAPGQRQFKTARDVEVKHFELPQGLALREFITSELLARKVTLSSSLSSFLSAFPVKTNGLYALVNEIEKASLAPARYRELAYIQNNETPFAITDALAQKKRALALQLLEGEFLINQKPVDLLNRILWQLRVLLIISDYKLQATNYKFPFHPFVVSKAKQALGLFSLAELTKLYSSAILLYERLLFSGLPSRILLSRFFWEL